MCRARLLGAASPTSRLTKGLQANPFDGALGDLALVADVEPGGARVGVAGELLRLLERAAVRHVGGEPHGAEGVVAQRGRDPGPPRPALDHRPGAGRVERPPGERAGPA